MCRYSLKLSSAERKQGLYVIASPNQAAGIPTFRIALELFGEVHSTCDLLLSKEL